MVSPHLELPTLAGAVNNLPTLMDDQTNLLDQALQGDVDFVVTAGGTIVISKTISLRNFMFNLTGTPSAAFNVDFPTNNRYFAVNNKSGETATIRIDGGGGTTVEVIDAEQRIIYIDGTDVIDVTGVGVPNLETLVTIVADFNIGDTTLTPIDWDAETRDEGSWHDNSTDPEQIKIGAGVVDAVAKIHVINLDADDTVTVKLQRYNSSDALQETLFEDNREHDASVDMVINLCVLNIRTTAGDYLTTEVKSSADTSYDIESDDSYFLVRRATTGGGQLSPQVDLDFEKVKFLSSLDGADLATTATDDSNTGHTIGFNGNAKLITGQKKFGTASADFDGTGDYLDIPTDPEFEFGLFDFTVEFWVRQVAEPAGNIAYLGKYDAVANDRQWGVQYAPGDNQVIGFFSKNGTDSFASSFDFDTDGITVGNFFNSVFHHIAFVRYRDFFALYVDGLAGSNGQLFNGEINENLTVDVIIGARADGAGVELEMTGQIDEVRITKGLARYTAPFTPPTAPFLRS